MVIRSPSTEVKGASVMSFIVHFTPFNHVSAAAFNTGFEAISYKKAGKKHIHDVVMIPKSSAPDVVTPKLKSVYDNVNQGFPIHESRRFRC